MSEFILDSKSFFTDVLNESSKEIDLNLVGPIKNYLSQFLINYISTQAYFEADQKTGKYTKSLFTKNYLEAQSLGGELKKNKLQKLAEDSLYISGLFSDSLKNKIIDIDFYFDIGKSAYGQLSSITDTHIIYTDLSNRFSCYADLLSIFSEKVHLGGETDLLREYEKYLIGDSKRSESKLIKAGVVLPPLKKEQQ